MALTMNPAEPIIACLNELLSRELHSFTRHMIDTKPHLTPRTYGAWLQVQAATRISQDHAQRIGELIESFGYSPNLSGFSQKVAFYHYMDVLTLLPILIDEKRELIRAYQKAIERASGHQAVRGELESLLVENRSQLEQFERSDKSLSGEARAVSKG
jgi:hypothetical protein